MAPECSHHTAFAEKIATHNAKIEELERDYKELNQKYVASLEKIAKLEGFYILVPQALTTVDRLQSKMERVEETANVYNRQLRDLTHTNEDLRKSLDTKASEESMANCYRWVKGGFVAVAAIALYEFLKKAGVIP